MPKNKQPQPEQPAPETSADVETTEQTVELRPSKRERVSLREQRRVQASKGFIEAAQNLSAAKQKLAEAQDYYAKGAGFEREADACADAATRLLYQGRINGNITADQVTEALGNQFGFKLKSDGKTPSKTPDGAGDTIRKRIVRVVAGHEYINGGDGGRFFEGLPVEDVAPIMHEYEDGLSIWQTYKDLTALKSEYAVRTNPVFDAKKVKAMLDALSEEGAADIVRGNPALFDTWMEIHDLLEIIDEVPADEAEQLAAQAA